MHHKRRRPKAYRAGCLLCKPSKLNAHKTADRMRARALSSRSSRPARLMFVEQAAAEPQFTRADLSWCPGHARLSGVGVTALSRLPARKEDPPSSGA